jgi:hypothetical protein
MRHDQFMLSGKDVCGWACEMLLSALSLIGWVSSGGSVNPLMLVQLLVRASAERRSFDAMGQLAKNLPCVETLRKALLRLLPATMPELEPVIIEALHAKLPKALKYRPRTMAIDLHTKPYYGDPTTPGTYRGQRKASTKTFFAYATLLAIRKGMTFTVALVPVVPGQELVVIIDQLLAQAAAKGLKPRRLLLDRGFYSARVMLDLQAKGIPFVIPMIRRGQSGRTQAECTATEQFFVAGCQGWTVYSWKARIRTAGRQAGSRTPVTIDVCMVPRKEGGRPLVFACFGLRTMEPQAVAACYRRRFRIETSYRQMREGLAMTCSKNPVYRLLLVLIALVLRNLWVYLHWTVFAVRRPGKKRTLQLKLLRARTMLHCLIRYLDTVLAIATSVPIPNPMATAA